MIINDIPIKKYKAKVKNIVPITTAPGKVNTDEYKIVEGYVSIASVILNDNEPTKPQFVPAFVAEEIDFGCMSSCGFGKTVLRPTIYQSGDFEIIGEVEE